jgi:hypothetical protein
MSTQRAVSLCGCLAALPLLIGCAAGGGPSQEAYAPVYGSPPGPPGYLPSQAYTEPVPAALGGEQVYAAGPAAPAAIVVLLPGPGESVTTNPQLWAAQGFDVVAPPPSEIDQLMADQQAAAAHLIASAQSMADAPIWLLGPNQAIEEAMASLPRGGVGQVAGVVVTATSSGAGTCSERMVYSYSGNGRAPKVSVSKSGDACPPGAPLGGTHSTVVPPQLPSARPHAPRLIEAAAPAGSPAAQREAVREIADLIKSPPPG